MSWTLFNELNPPQDDKNYLVAWLYCDGEYSTFHRAYYLESEGKFFSLENVNSHPLHVDVYFEVPDIEVE